MASLNNFNEILALDVMREIGVFMHSAYPNCWQSHT